MARILYGCTVAACLSLSSSLPAAQAGPSQIPTSLSLQAAGDLLLRHNPELAAARLQADVERGDVVGASKYSNPQFSFTSEGLGRSGPGSIFNRQELSLVVRQEILTGGKRDRRVQVEQTDVEIARMEVEDLERRLFLALKQAYYGVVLAQEDVALANSILSRFREVVRLNRLRFEQGEIAGGELRRVEAAQYQFYEDLITSEVVLRNSKDRLLALLGASDFSPDFTASDRFDAQFVPPPLPELRRIALRERVDLAIERARVRRSELVTAREKSRSKPNITVYGGYHRDFGQTGAIAGFEIPIFSFDRNQGPIERSLAENRQAQEMVNVVETRVLLEVQRAFNELDGNKRRIQALESEYLAIAEQSRDITDSAYRLGSSSLIELLEAERTYRETRRFHNRALYDHQISRAQLESAIGEDL